MAKKRITKDMMLGEILELNENMAGVLMSSGMHCVTCMAAAMETLEEAAYVHGIDADLLEVRLNAFLDAMDPQEDDAEEAADETAAPADGTTAQ